MSVYYKDDLVTLYHGDCLTEHTEWTSADVLVTDPPYGIEWEGIRSRYTDKINHWTVPANAITNDSTLDVRDTAIKMWGGVKPAMVFGVWRKDRPEGTKHRLVWWKRGQAPGPTRSPFVTQDEEIYVLGTGWEKQDSPLRSVIPTTEQRARYVSEIGHPTPKPIGLMELLLERCPPGVVADPFAGSGATLIAARNLGRECVGVEIEEKYCELIVQRLSQGALQL